MEQQVNMVVLVSHISVIQVLLSYFRQTPVAQCSSNEVPMNTVIKFTPVSGGGWTESQHKLGPDIEDQNAYQNSDSGSDDAIYERERSSPICCFKPTKRRPC